MSVRYCYPIILQPTIPSPFTTTSSNTTSTLSSTRFCCCLCCCNVCENIFVEWHCSYDLCFFVVGEFVFLYFIILVSIFMCSYQFFVVQWSLCSKLTLDVKKIDIYRKVALPREAFPDRFDCTIFFRTIVFTMPSRLIPYFAEWTQVPKLMCPQLLTFNGHNYFFNFSSYSPVESQLIQVCVHPW